MAAAADEKTAAAKTDEAKSEGGVAEGGEEKKEAATEVKKEEPAEASKDATTKTDDVPEVGEPVPQPTPVTLDGPKDPCIVCRPRFDASADPKTQFRLLMISLDGLLDYNLEDIMEKTFEASLFAELFNEMLQSRFAKRILEFMQETARTALLEEAAIRKVALDQTEKATSASLKRKADSSDEKGDAKKAKTKVSEEVPFVVMRVAP